MNAAVAASIAKGRNPFWDFEVWAYEREGVATACLALQDRFGADVNMIMFCLWLASCGEGNGKLARYLSAALKVSREWQRKFVEPLRDCRNNMKSYLSDSPLDGEDHAAMSSLREQIKQCELDMERMQAAAMYALVENSLPRLNIPVATQRELALNNVNVYMTSTGVQLDPLGQSHVQQILAAVFK